MSASSDLAGTGSDLYIDPNSLNWDFFSVDNKEGSLRSLYQNAVTKYNELDHTTLHPFTEAYRELHAEVLAKLLNCAEEIDRKSIFSPNETLEDLSTVSIPYLSVSFYIACALEKTTVDPSTSSVESRCEILQFSTRKYFEFLSLADDYGIISDANQKRIINLSLPEGLKGKFNLSEIVENSNESSGSSSRQARLAHDRLTRDMRNNLNNLNRILVSGMLGDEEKLRKALVLLAKYHVEMTFAALRDSANELIMLSQVSRTLGVMPLQERNIPYVPSSRVREYLQTLSSKSGVSFDEMRDERVNRDKHSARNSPLDSTKVHQFNPLGPQGRLLGPNGKVQQTFTILPASQASKMSRDEIRRNVYGTGQKLPTISIDELVDKELANMVETKPKTSSKIDEDSDAYVDAETMKARLWDEYTESVAKGSGNTLNLG